MARTDLPAPEPRLHRPRIVILASLSVNVMTTLFMPGLGLLKEPDPRSVGLGALGILAFAVAQTGALYAVATPWLSEPVRRRLLAGFAAAAVLSIPLVGPVGNGRWATWAWLGAAVVGTLPLLFRRAVAAVAMLTTLGVALAVAAWTGDPLGKQAIITGGIGLAIAMVSWLQMWFWDLLVRAEQGRSAQVRLAATEERLRFARDVHDLLGHSLSVIALKAELAARLAPIDAERAGREADEVRRLAASALAEVREAVHGYRAVDLRDQLAAVAQVLRSSGVRCTVTQPDGELPQEVAVELVPVLRETSTNVLRHSRAGWCTIEVSQDGDEVRMIVSNDGIRGTGPDRHSSGLRGLADRLADSGGVLRTRHEDGVFVVEAVVRTRSGSTSRSEAGTRTAPGSPGPAVGGAIAPGADDAGPTAAAGAMAPHGATGQAAP